MTIQMSPRIIINEIKVYFALTVEMNSFCMSQPNRNILKKMVFVPAVKCLLKS